MRTSAMIEHMRCPRLFNVAASTCIAYFESVSAAGTDTTAGKGSYASSSSSS